MEVRTRAGTCVENDGRVFMKDLFADGEPNSPVLGWTLDEVSKAQSGGLTAPVTITTLACAMMNLI